MKLSFSTRGWMDLSWDEIVSDAAEMRFGGIELYNVTDCPAFVECGGAFHKYSVVRTYRELREAGLCIPCLDSSKDLSSEETKTVEEIKELITLAADLKTPYVCVFAKENKIDLIRENIAKLLPFATQKGVTLLIKTSGVFADTALLRSTMDHFACDELAVLWDVHHPYRDKGESAAISIKNLGAYVKHVHMRDSEDDGSYCLVGEGTFPIGEVIDALSSIDYDGFVSLEWKREWMPEFTERDVIFPHYVNYMERFARSRNKTGKLYPNHDGTGWYVWKRDELIDLTFPQVLDRVTDEFPDQYCFKYTTLDYTRTYEEFRRDVDDFARALVSLGVKPGSKVTIWATNIPAWYITFWASARIGAILVTMNTAYKIHEAEYLLRQSDTHTLVMIDKALDSNYKEIINELCPEIAESEAGQPLHCSRLPFLRNVITVGFRQKGCLTFEEAMLRKNMVSADTTAAMAAAVRPDDVCNMQYTSGTTGFPKGVKLTHYNVVNNGKSIGDR
ncbi:MAG: AMP-binding protein, partial [Bacteroidales bacterium]|nr:AMP-binding protein [Bacteroidales bacterium]